MSECLLQDPVLGTVRFSIPERFLEDLRGIEELPFEFSSEIPTSPWVGGLFLKQDWEFLEQTICIHHIGKASGGKRVHAAVPRILEGHVQADAPTRPPFDLEGAIEGIRKHGSGLGRYYRTIADSSTRTQIECEILAWDIQVWVPSPCIKMNNNAAQNLDHANFNKFVLCCHYLSCLGNRDSDFVSLQRGDWGPWKDGVSRSIQESTSDPGNQLHRVALLRGILEWAGGVKDPRQQRWDLTLSTNDNLAIVLELLGIKGKIPHSGPDATALRTKFCAEETNLLKTIPRYVRIGLLEYGDLPQELAHSLSFRKIYAIQCHR